MMKDTDKLIIQAFLFALVQQKFPLPEPVRLELATIAANLAVKPMALHHFAVQSARLKTPYHYGYNWLVGREGIRTMGKSQYFPGDEEEEGDRGDEIENVNRDYYTTPVSKEEILERISANYNFPQAQQIFTAPDPVQAARNIYILVDS